MGRPVGVTILAVLDFLGAVLCVLGGIGMMVGGGFMATLINQQGSQGAGAGAGILAALGAALGVFLLICAAIGVLVGWGLWKLKNWARIVTIVFAVLGVLGALLGLATAFIHFSMFVLLIAIRIAICGLIIWYLLRPDVSAAFQGGQATAASA